MNIPDYFSILTGYREWGVYPSGLLVGLNHREAWVPYQAHKATCYGAHDDPISHLNKDGSWKPAPVFSCSCGIYGCQSMDSFKSLSAQRSSHWFYSNSSEHMKVWGEVKLWGRVIIHETGYRAEFGYPGQLYTNINQKMADRISSRYGVPCTYVKPKEKEESPEGPGGLRGQMRSLYNLASNPPVVPIPVSPGPSTALFMPTWAQVKAVGASRRQLYTGGRGGKTQTHWRDILAKMIYLHPKEDAEKKADDMTVK